MFRIHGGKNGLTRFMSFIRNQFEIVVIYVIHFILSVMCNMYVLSFVNSVGEACNFIEYTQKTCLALD